MSGAAVTIAGVASAIISYKGQSVCTTGQLARFYGCAERNLTDNYQRNAERFHEGKHYFRIEGAALRSFKSHIPADSGVVDERTARLIVWTKAGAARHAKMLTTDKAWEVFEEMEDAYFSARQTSATGVAPRHLTRSQVAAGILLLRSAAQDLKLAPSALLGGYQKLQAQIGVADLLPAYALDAPQASGATSSEETKSAAELLKAHGVPLSAIAFNQLLVQRGILEERERASSKGGTRKFKVCTDMEYGKNLTNPSNPRETQPHWYSAKFAALLQRVLPESDREALAA